jgi:hypothetical protein
LAVKEIFGRLRGVLLAIFVVCCLGVGSPVSGEDLGFIVTWSGAALGNGASATGRITIDDLILLNPGQIDTIVNSFVVEFTMTVAGASSGNGTFGLADFDRIELRTGPGTAVDLPLDLSQELVGKDTGTDPWGTQSAGGGSPVASDGKDQLLTGGCGLSTATGSVGGAGHFGMSWKAGPDGALKSAKVRSLGGALTGTLDSVSTYFGDCKINGSTVSEGKVPAELLASIP